VDGIMLGLDARVLSLSNSLDNLEKEVEKATTNDVARANQTRPYFVAKRKLEELERFRQILDMKIAAEKIEDRLANTTRVVAGASDPLISRTHVWTFEGPIEHISMPPRMGKTWHRSRDSTA
jgi:hypothetical protein